MLLVATVWPAPHAAAQSCSSVPDLDEPHADHAPVPNETEESPSVVVAVIDSGINPYHEVFERPALTDPPSTYIDAYPKESTAIDLDAPIDWDAIEDGKLHWFPGTNIVGAISFGDYDTCYGGEGRIIDNHGHGTATASNVVFANPDVKVVMVETDSASLTQAVGWAADQPWIDVLSVSWGTIGNVPAPSPNPDHTRRAEASGKLVFFAAGNEPTPGSASPHAGPPWVIRVGGAERTANGTTAIAGKLPDVVSNFTQVVADRTGTDTYRWWDGTSFATPTAAGVASDVVLRMRQEAGHTDGLEDGALVDANGTRITNDDVRDALNATASYWATSSWDPTGFEPSPFEDPHPDRSLVYYGIGATGPASPAPFLQMGWGYVGPDTADRMVTTLQGGDPDLDPVTERNKALAEPYMEALYEARKAYWDVRPVRTLADAVEAVPCSELILLQIPRIECQL